MERFEDYDQMVKGLAIYPGKGELGGLYYCGLKLAGEAGEVANKLGKIIRDKNGKMDSATRTALIYELGDVLWYVSALAQELASDTEEVAHLNQVKLEDRKARGVLGGDGDYR